MSVIAVFLANVPFALDQPQAQPLEVTGREFAEGQGMGCSSDRRLGFAHRYDALPLSRRYLRGRFPNPLPGLGDVAGLGMGLADAEPQRESTVQTRVGQIQVAALIQTIQ